MGYLNQKQIEERINNPDNLVNKVVHKIKHSGQGRVKGDKNLTPDQREIAGTLSKYERQEDVAELLGISQSTVSNSARGLISNTKLDPVLDKKIKDNTKTLDKQISSSAIDVLMSSIEMTGAKLSDNPREAKLASSIAMDMATIANRFGVGNEGGIGKVQIVFTIPRQKSLDDYNVIDVNSIHQSVE